MTPPLTPMGNLRWHYVRRLIARTRPKDILEIGCGIGAAGVRLARTARYVGVEPDPESFKTAAARVEPLGGTVVNGMYADLPGDSTYDMVCAFEVLEHIEDDAGTLADWVRLLRPGGHLVLSVPAWQERFGKWDEYAGHFRRYSPDGLATRLREAGLDPVHTRAYAWPLGYALESVRNRALLKRAAVEESADYEERTAGSGRILQPRGIAGVLVRVGITPFQYVQRLAPGKGTGVVAWASRPTES